MLDFLALLIGQNNMKELSIIYSIRFDLISGLLFNSAARRFTFFAFSSLLITGKEMEAGYWIFSRNIENEPV